MKDITHKLTDDRYKVIHLSIKPCRKEMFMIRLYAVFIVFLFSVFVVGCNPAFAQSETNTIKKEDFRKGIVKISSKGRQGTGFVVGVFPDEVYIITVVHVVEGDPEPTIEFFENQESKAKILSAEESGNGLALLVVKDSIPVNIMPLYVAKETNLNLGDTVFTFGFPRGGARWAYDALSYAGQMRRHLTFSESDIEEGNSGGPIIKDNQVVGILTSKLQYAFATSAQNIREFLHGVKGGIKAIDNMEKRKHIFIIPLVQQKNDTILEKKETEEGIKLFKAKRITKRDESKKIQIARQAEIIDIRKIYPAINRGDCLNWLSQEIKAKGGVNKWDSFYPKKGDIGIIVDEMTHCHSNEKIYILNIGRYYVPVGSNGIRVK